MWGEVGVRLPAPCQNLRVKGHLWDCPPPHTGFPFAAVPINKGRLADESGESCALSAHSIHKCSRVSAMDRAPSGAPGLELGCVWPLSFYWEPSLGSSFAVGCKPTSTGTTAGSLTARSQCSEGFVINGVYTMSFLSLTNSKPNDMYIQKQSTVCSKFRNKTPG